MSTHQSQFVKSNFLSKYYKGEFTLESEFKQSFESRISETKKFKVEVSAEDQLKMST